MSAVDKKLATVFAKEYVRIHNEAEKEFSAAFKRAGAKMWRGDSAHKLNPKKTIKFLVKTLTKSMNLGEPSEWPTRVLKIWSIARPLLVLDGYPKVKRNGKVYNTLVDTVNEIHHRKQREFETAVNGIFR